MTRVTAVRRRPNPYATLLPTEVLELELSSGETVAVFAKRLEQAQADHPDKQRGDREPLLYESLLASPGLPVPRCLGVRRDREGRARELYLEHVDGLDLRYQDLEVWYEAARSLAGLHRRFAGHAEILRSDVLLRIDRAYVEAWARRAAAEAAAIDRRSAARLSGLVEDLEPATDLLAAQPATLVHNDLSPKNAMAAGGGGQARIAFVDWELAGAGCGVLDVVHLAYGLGPDPRRRLFDAYWRELEGSPLAVEEARRGPLVAACELHKTLYRLAHARSLGVDAATVRRWVEEAAGWRGHL